MMVAEASAEEQQAAFDAYCKAKRRADEVMTIEAGREAARCWVRFLDVFVTASGESKVVPFRRRLDPEVG